MLNIADHRAVERLSAEILLLNSYLNVTADASETQTLSSDLDEDDDLLLTSFEWHANCQSMFWKSLPNIVNHIVIES